MSTYQGTERERKYEWPFQLYRMINEGDPNVIRWNGRGDGFIISSKIEFEKPGGVLSKFFPSAKSGYAAFSRSCCNYFFKSVSSRERHLPELEHRHHIFGRDIAAERLLEVYNKNQLKKRGIKIEEYLGMSAYDYFEGQVEQYNGAAGPDDDAEAEDVYDEGTVTEVVGALSSLTGGGGGDEVSGAAAGKINDAASRSSRAASEVPPSPFLKFAPKRRLSSADVSQNVTPRLKPLSPKLLPSALPPFQPPAMRSSAKAEPFMMSSKAARRGAGASAAGTHFSSEDLAARRAWLSEGEHLAAVVDGDDAELLRCKHRIRDALRSYETFLRECDVNTVAAAVNEGEDKVFIGDEGKVAEAGRMEDAKLLLLLTPGGHVSSKLPSV